MEMLQSECILTLGAEVSRLDRKRLKFLLLGSGVLLSMTFLIVVGMTRQGGMVYYMTVTEYMQRTQPVTGDSRVNGTVSIGTIARMPTGLDVRFVMTDGVTSVPVSYHGIIPDTFVDDAAVVVEGRLQDDGTFHAHTLLAKCPSKYETAEDYAPADSSLESSVAH